MSGTSPRQLLQTVISNLPIGLCLLSVRGEINMVNRRFSMDLELPETGTTGRNLSQFLPQPCKGMDFCHSADYKVMNRSGKHLLLSSLELLLPNHEPLYLLTSTPCPVLADGTTEYPAAPRRFLGMLFKKLGKIVGVLNAHTAGHLVYPLVRALQKLFGSLYADGHQIIHEINSHDRLKRPAEIGVINIVNLGNLGQ